MAKDRPILRALFQALGQLLLQFLEGALASTVLTKAQELQTDEDLILTRATAAKNSPPDKAKVA